MTDSPGDILLALGRLEGKVDALMAQESRTQTDLDGLEDRVRILEGSRAILFGACAVIGSLVSYVVALLT